MIESTQAQLTGAVKTDTSSVSATESLVLGAMVVLVIASVVLG